MVNTWTINERDRNPSRVAYRGELGESLRSIASGLRCLDGGLNQNLRLASTTISTPVYKILIDGTPLVRRIQRAKLPPLMSATALRGQSPELFRPLTLTIGAPESGPGTGLITTTHCWILPLYGMEYQSEQRKFIPYSMWDIGAPWLRTDTWLKQNMVEFSDGRHQTIGDIIREIRNKRGSHTDPGWIADFPQTLRQFYTVYADYVMVQVGMLLLDVAASSLGDEDFRTYLFPDIEDPAASLYYAPLPEGDITTPQTKLGDAPDIRWSIETKHIAGLYHLPSRGAGTTAMTVGLLAFGAPGWRNRPPPFDLMEDN